MNLPGGVKGQRPVAARARLPAEDFCTPAGDDEVEERRDVLVGREAKPGGVSGLQGGDPRDRLAADRTPEERPRGKLGGHACAFSIRAAPEGRAVTHKGRPSGASVSGQAVRSVIRNGPYILHLVPARGWGHRPVPPDIGQPLRQGCAVRWVAESKQPCQRFPQVGERVDAQVLARPHHAVPRRRRPAPFALPQNCQLARPTTTWRSALSERLLSIEQYPCSV